MLKQYALDPDVVTDGMAFTAFVGGLGVENGRVMAEYPRIWIRMAIERVRAMPETREKKRAELLLERLRTEAQLKCKTGLPFDGTLAWLVNAEHHVDAFDAVIHPDDVEPSAPSERMFPATSLLEDQPYWQVNRDVRFRAVAGEFKNLLLPLARHQSRLAIMDPYFEPQRDTYVQGLKEIMQVPTAPCSVVVHTSAEGTAGKEIRSSQEWQEVCSERLSPLVDAGTSLTIVRWNSGASGTRPHARWLVTPLGGVLVDKGFAVDRRMNSISLMGAVEAARRWAAYGIAPFAVADYDLRDIVNVNRG